MPLQQVPTGLTALGYLRLEILSLSSPTLHGTEDYQSHALYTPAGVTRLLDKCWPLL